MKRRTTMKVFSVALRGEITQLMQAAVQALQPIQVEISMSLATCVVLAASAGGVIVVADWATTLSV